MKIFIFSIIFTFSSCYIFSQQISWQRGGGNPTSYPLVSFERNRGIYYIFGNSSHGFGLSKDTISNGKTICLMIMDSLGCIKEVKYYGPKNLNSRLKDVVELSDGYLLASTVYSGKSGDKTEDGFGLHDVWIVKIDFNGNIIWEKQYGGSGDDGFNSNLLLVKLKNKEIAFCVSTNSNISGNITTNTLGGLDIWIVKIDSVGKIVKQSRIGGEKDDLITSFVYDGNNYIIASSSYSPIGGSKTVSGEIWLLKLDSNFGIELQKGIDNYVKPRFAFMQNDLYLITSSKGINLSMQACGFGEQDILVSKMDKQFNILWENCFGGKFYDTYSEGFAFDIIPSTVANKIIIYSLSNSPISGNKTVSSNYGETDAWIFNIDAFGSIDNQFNFGGSLNDTPISSMPTLDGGTLYLFHSNSPISGNKTVDGDGGYWIVKTGGRCVIRTEFTKTICIGDTLVILGTKYHQTKLTGEEIIRRPNQNCDSVICVNLSMVFPDTTIIKGENCYNDKFAINGVLFDKNNTFYLFKYSNEWGCDSIVDVNFKFYDSLYLQSFIQHDNGNSNGSITINVVGGKAPYRYRWSNGGTNSTISNLKSGPYSVTCIDSLNCSELFTFYVQSTVANSDTILFTPYIKETDNDLTLSDVGGLSIQMFSIRGDRIQLPVVNSNRVKISKEVLIPGIYLIIVKDRNGKSYTKKFIAY